MTPRDDRVSPAYWADAIAVLERSIEEFRPFSHVFRPDDTRAGIVRTKANFESTLFLLGARYSAGYSVSALADDLESVVSVWENRNRYAAVPDGGFPLETLTFDNKSAYYYALWLSSVARCVGVEQALTERLVRIVDAAGGADPVLAQLLGIEPVRDTVWHKRPFQNLATASTAKPDRAVAALDRYLQAWQKNISFIWWAPALQAVQGDRFAKYFGYWAWEAAGLVVARGFDDTSLRSSPFYPADLVDARHRGS
ncbi:PoNe immunity protein domain-containing protein [uncultured Curtobacterium sp.]|uniref:PoNe immunity protein domain-containing protein n=1 Tax=uncultured Curtobacterium sp. TaxID=331964 RepID=UPI0025865639|nr:PoNe immunity protein domain-containing protein [uncultured Curtobacterium sp.]